MKKIFTAVLAAMIKVQSVFTVYAEGEVFLPEAKGDFIYTIIHGKLLKNLLIPFKIPEMDFIMQKVNDQMLPDMELQAVTEPTADVFTADFTVEGDGFNKENEIVFALYDGETLVDKCEYKITSDTKEFSVTFSTPEYKVGKQFEIACMSGADAVRYYEELYGMGQKIPAPTYQYLNEDGERIVVTETAMNILTAKEKTINIYIDDELFELKSLPRVVNGTIMVPVREMSEAVGVFDVAYDAEYNSVRVAIANNEILFNLDYPWSTVNGEDRAENVQTRYFGKNIYVSLDTLTDGLECEKEQTEYETYTDIKLTRSKHAVNPTDKLDYIEKQKLTSRTDYLIWISKKNYEVNVFKKVGGKWDFVKAFPCAIGTDATPTCVGTYRYYEKIERWTYPDFYVGPVMRFNGGYAIHSTLLNFDGTDYNRTVRRKLSHGCVRVQPPDMNWLIENIPMYTTIHVTNT